jgi:glutamyl-Q tRNA(Asp) synthetase
MIVGRFAPSPTGPLHLGSLVTAAGSYIMAKRAGGRWLLRIEDLDIPRVIPGMADDILKTLEKFGFQWDGEVTFQSRRSEVYQATIDKLRAEDLAYPCSCTRAEIARIASAPHPGSEGLVYPGICRYGLAEGKTARAYRVKVDNMLIEFEDGIMGHYSQSLTASCGDFVVQRADGPFAYHLAVVVDDAESGVNQVVRGSDLLSSTPRQIYLQKLLHYPVPAYFHLPLVTNPDGTKLSKRANAVSLTCGRDLTKDRGLLLLSSLRFLGQSPPFTLEKATCPEILAWAVSNFDLGLIPTADAPLRLT